MSEYDEFILKTFFVDDKCELNNNVCFSCIQSRENEPGLIEMEPLVNRNGPQYPTMVRVHERSSRQPEAAIIRARVGGEIEWMMMVKLLLLLE